MRRPNYRFERAERDRNKQAKKAEKLKRQQERLVTNPDDGGAEPAAESEAPQGPTGSKSGVFE